MTNSNSSPTTAQLVQSGNQNTFAKGVTPSVKRTFVDIICVNKLGMRPALYLPKPGQSKKVSAILLTIFTLSGCVSQPVAETAEATTTAQAAPIQTMPAPPPQIAPEKLNELLTRADNAARNEHLTFPKQGSAFQIYSEILAVEPSQEDAMRGLEHIVERYMNLALNALAQQQFAQARSMLNRAKLVLPNHPSIEPTEAQLRLLSEAERKTVKLSQELFANLDEGETQAAQLQLALQDLSAIQNPRNCRFRIWARNDAQGRKIYQTLSQSARSTSAAQGGMRLRAQIDLRMPAAVERTCFNR